jgi:hypothetical protein
MPQLPTELLNTIGVILELFVAGMTALLVAFWIGLVVWTFRDIRSRTRDVFAWFLAAVLVLILGPIGWLLYFLLRPRETLAQVYDRQLEEEVLLRDITTRRARLPQVPDRHRGGLAVVSALRHRVAPPVRRLRPAVGAGLDRLPVLHRAGRRRSGNTSSQDRATATRTAGDHLHARSGGRPRTSAQLRAAARSRSRMRDG